MFTPSLVKTLCAFGFVVDTSIWVATTFLLSAFSIVVTSPTASVTTKSHCAYKSSLAHTTTVAVPLPIAVILPFAPILIIPSWSQK